MFSPTSPIKGTRGTAATDNGGTAALISPRETFLTHSDNLCKKNERTHTVDFPPPTPLLFPLSLLPPISSDANAMQLFLLGTFPVKTHTHTHSLFRSSLSSISIRAWFLSPFYFCARVKNKQRAKYLLESFS